MLLMWQLLKNVVPVESLRSVHTILNINMPGGQSGPVLHQLKESHTYFIAIFVEKIFLVATSRQLSIRVTSSLCNP